MDFLNTLPMDLVRNIIPKLDLKTTMYLVKKYSDSCQKSLPIRRSILPILTVNLDKKLNSKLSPNLTILRLLEIMNEVQVDEAFIYRHVIRCKLFKNLVSGDAFVRCYLAKFLANFCTKNDFEYIAVKFDNSTDVSGKERMTYIVLPDSFSHTGSFEVSKKGDPRFKNKIGIDEMFSRLPFKQIMYISKELGILTIKHFNRYVRNLKIRILPSNFCKFSQEGQKIFDSSIGRVRNLLRGDPTRLGNVGWLEEEQLCHYINNTWVHGKLSIYGLSYNSYNWASTLYAKIGDRVPSDEPKFVLNHKFIQNCLQNLGKNGKYKKLSLSMFDRVSNYSEKWPSKKICSENECEKFDEIEVKNKFFVRALVGLPFIEELEIVGFNVDGESERKILSSDRNNLKSLDHFYCYQL